MSYCCTFNIIKTYDYVKILYFILLYLWKISVFDNMTVSCYRSLRYQTMLILKVNRAA